MSATPGQGVLGVYRRYPALLLGTAFLVFAPLAVPRFLAVDAGRFPLAIGLTFLGHVVVAFLLWRRRASLGVRSTTPGALVAAGLLATTGLEIIAGRGIDMLLGPSTLVITLGGTVPSIVLGPVWALLVVGFAERRIGRGSTSSR